MLDLVLDVPAGHGRRAALEDALRRAVRSGQLHAGTRLPSSRSLASELGLARATVVAVYEQLVAEGYLHARQGAGTTVAAVPLPPDLRPATSGRRDQPSFNLAPGEPDRASFPRARWLASLRRVLSASGDELFGYGDPRGQPVLRRALAPYLGRSRAVVARADCISVVAGMTAGLALLAETLRAAGIDRLAIEDPGMLFHWGVLRASGLELVPVPVDAEGISVAELEATGAGAVLVTPAHQYPLGMTLSPTRRAALLDWARRRDAWVIEDDYDGEFRYDRQPVGALQGLDPHRVVYAGTASKSLAAGLRLAWLVLPPALVEPFAATKDLRGGASAVEQAALADFVASGSLDGHIRQMRARYRRRRDTLVNELGKEAPWLELAGVSAGLHVTVYLPAHGPSEQHLVAAAAPRSVGLFGLGPHWYGDARAEGLVLGYSRPPDHAFPRAVELLVALLRDHAPSR